MIRQLCAVVLAATSATAQPITPDQLAMLLHADVIWLGEVHDHPDHHTHQEQAIQSIQPAALVMEMLTPDQARAATADARATEAGLRAALAWDTSGWPDFALYFPVIAAAGDAPLFPAALTREEARTFWGMGLAEAFGSDAARFGLDQPLPPNVQAAQITLQNDAHCNAMPAEMLPAMVDIQRLRDARLAQAALDAYTQTGGPVVVIAGTGHLARDWGAPALLEKAAPDLSQLVIGQFEADPGQPAMDYWIVTDPYPRPDPCAAFR